MIGWWTLLSICRCSKKFIITLFFLFYKSLAELQVTNKKDRNIMVNIESIESIQGEKNDSFQEKMEPIVEEVENLVTSDSAAAIEDIKIEERLLDAQAIEELTTNIDRPSARSHLEALVKKITIQFSSFLNGTESSDSSCRKIFSYKGTSC